MNVYEEYLMTKEAKIDKKRVLDTAVKSGLAGAAVGGIGGAASTGYHYYKRNRDRDKYIRDTYGEFGDNEQSIRKSFQEEYGRPMSSSEEVMYFGAPKANVLRNTLRGAAGGAAIGGLGSAAYGAGLNTFKQTLED